MEFVSMVIAISIGIMISNAITKGVICLYRKMKVRGL